jgi:NAD-dependent SIR2 family protein deacetylase
MASRGSPKTVFIIGAGFSCLAAIPTQDKLLYTMRRHYRKVPKNDPNKASWLEVSRFFKGEIGDRIDNYLIEDLFTILDKCLLDDVSFRHYDIGRLNYVYDCLLGSTKAYINSLVKTYFSSIDKKNPYLKLASQLVAARKSFKYKENRKSVDHDRLSIITLNWDCLLEFALNKRSTNPHDPDLDYCIYDYSYSPRHIPSITKKPKGKMNLKVLKPHGSSNWGVCRQCGRLYISYGRTMLSGDTEKECKWYCRKQYEKALLAPLMVMPTYLKSLGSVHLQEIWTNAAIEINEADRIVFIGYSLRPEDYHFRYLLSKSIRPETEVYVFDYERIETLQKDRNKTTEKKFSDFLQLADVKYCSAKGWENELDLLGQLARGEQVETDHA